MGDVNHAVSCLLSDPSYPLDVEVFGKVPGGRWAVRLAGFEDSLNAGGLLPGAGLARSREDLMAMVDSEEKEMIEPKKKIVESKQDPILTKPEAAIGHQPTLLKSEPSKAVPSKPEADADDGIRQNTKL